MNKRRFYAVLGLVGLVGLFLLAKPNKGIDGFIYVAYLVVAGIAYLSLLAGVKAKESWMLQGLEITSVLLWGTVFVRAIYLASKMTTEPKPLSLWLVLAFVFCFFLPPGILSKDAIEGLEDGLLAIPFLTQPF